MSKIFSIIFCVFIITSTAMAAEYTEKKPVRGLVYLVDQEFGLPNLKFKVPTWGQNAIWDLRPKFETVTWNVGSSWDGLRSIMVDVITCEKYDHVYMAIGEQRRDQEFLKNLWAKALKECDVIDYIAMLHGNRAKFSDELEIPKDSGKIRLVYNEGCEDGNGKENFVENYGAQISVGHNAHPDVGHSASPFFSFYFLSAWCSGLPLEEALEQAWNYCKYSLSTRIGYKIVSAMDSSFKNVDQMYDATMVQYCYRESVDPKTFTVDSAYPVNSGDDAIIEVDIEDLKNK